MRYNDRTTHRKGSFYLELEKLDCKGMKYQEYLLLSCMLGFRLPVQSLAMCARCQLLIYEPALSRFDDGIKISKEKGRNVRMEKRI